MRRHLLLVVQKGDHSLGYYDPQKGAEQDRVAIDPFPHEFAVTEDGRYAFCCHFGVALAEDEGPGGHTVSIVDIAARRRIGTLDCGDFRRPHDIALDGKGAAYVLSEGASRLLVSRAPLRGRFDHDQPTGGEGSHMLTVTRDGRLAFSSNMRSASVSALFPDDPARPPVVIPVGQRPEGSVLDPDERLMYVVNRESADISVIDLHSLTVTGTIATRPGPVRVCWDQQRRLLVPLYHDRSLAVIDPHNPRAQIAIALPEKPISISFDATDALAFLSTLGNEVCVVDVEAKTVVRRIATRNDPDPTALIR